MCITSLFVACALLLALAHRLDENGRDRPPHDMRERRGPR
mgnify:CR=1 FL=1